MAGTKRDVLELLAKKYIRDVQPNSEAVPVEENLPKSLLAKVMLPKKERSNITLMDLQRAMDLAG